MATAQLAEIGGETFEETLCRLANEHADSPECTRILSVPLTMKRAAAICIERIFFNLNRRDCWGAVQCKAPFEVKKMIWAHERDELAGNPERGAPDHITLRMREGAASFGLSEDDFRNKEPTIFTKTASNAWLNVAQQRPWLHAIAASAALELANSEEVLKNGSGSGRWARRQRDALGISFEKQVSGVEHMEVDVEHGNMLLILARQYGTTPEARQQILDGVNETFAIEKVFMVGLAELMESIPD